MKINISVNKRLIYVNLITFDSIFTLMITICNNVLWDENVQTTLQEEVYNKQKRRWNGFIEVCTWNEGFYFGRESPQF